MAESKGETKGDIVFRGFTYTSVVPLATVHFHGQMHPFEAQGTIHAGDPRFQCFAALGALGRCVLVYDSQTKNYYETPLASVAACLVREVG